MCDELCRLCLCRDNLILLFSNSEQNDGYRHVLSLTTGLTIEPNDGFPQHICQKCNNDVNSALDLRNRSQQSQNKLIELGFQIIFNNKTAFDENIVQNNEIITQLIEIHENSNEIEADFENIDGFPELKIEIECDRLDQDDDDTKWPTNATVKKLSRKEKRQQYLDMVDGKFDPNGPIKCKICQKSVSTWKCFISHTKLHLGFNFVCEFCGKSFISITQLKRHCRSHHGMKRDLPCKHCGYLALDNAQLKVHERRMHTFERPYVCDACGASYHNRRCLVQHIESHRSEATVQCDQCPQSFKSNRQLSRHRYRTHKFKQPRAFLLQTNNIDV